MLFIAQGMAQEDKSSSRINQTSFVENCETSAVGRALGFLGIGIETSIATADEVDMAIKKQDSTSKDKGKSGSDVFSSSVTYIKDGKNKPERATRLAQITAKYGDTLTKAQQTKLVNLV